MNESPLLQASIIKSDAFENDPVVLTSFDVPVSDKSEELITSGTMKQVLEALRTDVSSLPTGCRYFVPDRIDFKYESIDMRGVPPLYVGEWELKKLEHLEVCAANFPSEFLLSAQILNIDVKAPLVLRSGDSVLLNEDSWDPGDRSMYNSSYEPFVQLNLSVIELSTERKLDKESVQNENWMDWICDEEYDPADRQLTAIKLVAEQS